MSFEVSEPGALVSASQSPETQIGRAFIASVLLTGNIEAAKHAVMHAIESWNPAGPMNDALLCGTIENSLERSREFAPAHPENSQFLLDYLPIELRRLFSLTPAQRHSFVLRALLQLPLETCAGMLRLSTSDVRRHVCDASEQLPRL